MRLGDGFATPQIFKFLEAEDCDYVVAIGKGMGVSRRAARLMAKARRHSIRSGRTASVRGDSVLGAMVEEEKASRYDQG